MPSDPDGVVGMGESLKWHGGSGVKNDMPKLIVGMARKAPFCYECE